MLLNLVRDATDAAIESRFNNHLFRCFCLIGKAWVMLRQHYVIDNVHTIKDLVAVLHFLLKLETFLTRQTDQLYNELSAEKRRLH